MRSLAVCLLAALACAAQQNSYPFAVDQDRLSGAPDFSFLNQPITAADRVVVRGDREQGQFSAFCYKSGQLVGIESINRASDHVFGRRVLAMNRSIEPEQAADIGFELKCALT